MKSDAIVYRGFRDPDEDGKTDTSSEVLVFAYSDNNSGPRNREIKPRYSQKLRNHSPDGFSWGYSGSGPAQLALALLLDFTEDQKVALEHYQDFKFKYVSGWKGDNWKITGKEIREFLDSLKAPATSSEEEGEEPG